MGAKKAKKAKKKSAPEVEWPVCVRHGRSRKDSHLRHFWMCDKCATKWQEAAFEGAKPVLVGDPIRGHCALCSEVFDRVRLRCWFLCNICYRVAASIGRSHKSEESVEAFWRDKVLPKYPHLLLTRLDIAELRHVGDRPTSGQAEIDFVCTDRTTGEEVFAIENKTGRSSMRGMSAFQLDVSDCDCILHAVTERGVPAYVMHAQVIEDWMPPTVGFKAVGLWWSDIYRMTDHFRRIRRRRDEQRSAAFFGKRAFDTVDAFVEQLYVDEELRLPKLMAERGIPEMYRMEDD